MCQRNHNWQYSNERGLIVADAFCTQLVGHFPLCSDPVSCGLLIGTWTLDTTTIMPKCPTQRKNRILLPHFYCLWACSKDGKSRVVQLMNPLKVKRINHESRMFSADVNTHPCESGNPCIWPERLQPGRNNVKKIRDCCWLQIGFECWLCVVILAGVFLRSNIATQEGATLTDVSLVIWYFLSLSLSLLCCMPRKPTNKCFRDRIGAPRLAYPEQKWCQHLSGF